MKQKIKVATNPDEIQCLYSQDWEYRESDLAAFPAQIEDVYHALNFIPDIADNFHIDLNKIFLMGNSSGGHIAMMSVLFHANGLCNALPKISGVICESGSTDLLICAKEKLPPWMEIRPSAVLLGVDNIEGHEELEGNDVHGGATYYHDEILDIVQDFCENKLSQAA